MDTLKTNGINTLKSTVRYQLEYIAFTVLICFAAVFVVSFFVSGSFQITTNTDISTISLSFGAVITLTFFIVGTIGIREDLLLFLQHGFGRRTTYLSSIISTAIASAVMGAFCVMLNQLFALWPAFVITGLLMPTTNLFVSWIMHALTFIFAMQFGKFISLLFYRMSKLQTIIFVSAFISFFVAGIPYLIMNAINRGIDIEASIEAFIENLAGNPQIIWPNARIAVILVLVALSIAGNYLLIRRVQIKGD